MYEIELRFKDFDDRLHWLRLNPNQVLSVFDIRYPIIWFGKLDNFEIELKQLNTSSSMVEDYEFLKFPDTLNHCKAIVIREIDNKLNILN